MNKKALTISDFQKDILNKKYSFVENVETYFENIEKEDKKFNSFITLNKADALLKAKKLDEISAKENIFEKLPLAGVCVSHKDMYLTKGLRTTAGSKILEEYIPEYSATAVEKLENSGCICIGKTNQDAWAHGSSGENSDFGPTRNPWNGDYVPGGSSSGSAASLVANFSLISTGTDTCGSIRLPANFCYLYGLKPTYGSVSRYGIIAMASSVDSIGHFARNVSDLRTVFNITKGVDNYDATLKKYNEKPKNSKFTIGIPEEFFGDDLDSEVKENILKAIDILKKKNIDFVNISLPSTKYALAVYYIIQPAEVSSNLARYDGIRFGKSRKYFAQEAKRRIMIGTFVLSSGYYDQYYQKAMKTRSLIIKEINESFTKVDAIIAPVSSTGPFKLGEKTQDPLKMYLTDVYAATANLTGIPGIAIPFQFSKKGLPLGFQIMADRFREDVLFDIAEIFENETDYKPKIREI